MATDRLMSKIFVCFFICNGVRNAQVFGENFGGNYGENFGGNYGENFGGNFGGNFGKNFGGSFGENFGGSFGENFGGNLGGSFGGNRGGSFGDNFGGSFGDNFGGNFGSNFGGSFGSNFGENFGDLSHEHRAWRPWTPNEQFQLNKMSEKLMSELGSARPNYGQTCNSGCFIVPELVGRTKEEIRQIAGDMTSQIMQNIQSGTIVRPGIDDPNWFERHAQKMLELRYRHLEEFERNLRIARGNCSTPEPAKIQLQTIREILEQKLREIGVVDMCEQEIRQAITTGVFIRGGYKYVYNSAQRQFEKIQLTTEERQIIFAVIERELRRLGYRLLTEKENEDVLIKGHFIRDSHQWIYNIAQHTIVKTIYVEDFESTYQEYNEMYQKVQDTLRRIGYPSMSASECNATIDSGRFERGGIIRIYNPTNREFELKLLDLNEYRHRKQVLRHQLIQLGHGEISDHVYGKLIYQGYFYYGGYRYEYNTQSGRYERIELTAEEYRERVRQLREQLAIIGYGTMTDAECNVAIVTGKFRYNGYEWVYNSVTRDYQKGNPYTGNCNNTGDRGDQRPPCQPEVPGPDEIVVKPPVPTYPPVPIYPQPTTTTSPRVPCQYPNNYPCYQRPPCYTPVPDPGKLVVEPTLPTNVGPTVTSTPRPCQYPQICSCN